ncbi:glutamate synthase subunit beta [Ornithinimicrobium tianjinense]|uniref:Dihydropyrimidine dehydrogenase subunit A n=1 Tax=Ornithinimicrobium tianjinense TaxID=1195761 RepID=A0A917BL64_9MICO|nr:glutamate synthase subunit beta [Ornithinimicrobium tianjinense]GGF48131.1 dihydropyrimidine dehydrogenase subunit A [Ornithinimicrobium tianjinense]
MADPTGFLTHRERENRPSRPVPVRIRDWKEVHGEQDTKVLQRQAGRCMDCGIPFCHTGCPLGNLIPEWNDHTRRANFADAIERLHATNNFPEFTGRLCPAPCETACVLGINQPPVTIKQIEVSIIDRAFSNGRVKPEEPEWLSGRTVAVIGSGPAGLAAAQQLGRAGHTVVVYERDDAVGGLLRYGIPEFKMEKAVLDRRLVQLRAEGIRFVTGMTVGGDGPDDLSLQDLRERFDAVVLATGSTVPRMLDVPGADLDGVHAAMEFLVPANREALGAARGIDAEGKDVVIIGGGDTGADCLGTAHRHGARSVTQLEILPTPPTERPSHQPWPTYPMLYKVTEAHEEGGERTYGVSTLEILGEDGKVSGLRLADARLVEGRVQIVEGTERDVPAQLVLLAMGFVGPDESAAPATALPRTARNTYERDGDFATPLEGVFAAGDCGRGQSLIVWAIAEGRAAAAAVDRYLTGSTTLPAPIRPTDRPLTV